MQRIFIGFLLLSLGSFAVSLGILSLFTSRQPDVLLPSQNAIASPRTPEMLVRVAALEKQLNDDWDDGEGWKKFGRSNMMLGRSSKAVAASSQETTPLPPSAEVNSAWHWLEQIAVERNSHRWGRPQSRRA